MSFFAAVPSRTSAGTAIRASVASTLITSVQDAAVQAQLDTLLEQQKRAEADAAAAQAYADDIAGPSPLVYVGASVGALVLLGLLAVAIKRHRKGKLRGYRRRR